MELRTQPVELFLGLVKPENGKEGLRKYDPEAFALFDDFYSGRIKIDELKEGAGRRRHE